jgi:hypothetical protein
MSVARGAAPSAQRVVQCYHCRHRYDVSRKAESVNGPEGSQRVIVGDGRARAARSPVSRPAAIVVHEGAHQPS